MIIKKSYFVIIALFATLLLNNIYSQSIGKLYTKEDANTLYGRILDSVEIEKSELESMLKKTKNVIMFNIVKGKLIILGDNRNFLSTATPGIRETDAFYLFSKDKVNELLQKGKSNTVVVELRTSKLTVTNGAVTMQEAVICPPFCH